MKRYSFLLVLAIVCLISANADARTFAANLSVKQDKIGLGNVQEISYHLNDDASSVTIDIKNSSAVTVRTLSGGTSQGLNVVQWDLKDTGGTDVPLGDYTFSISTQDVGYATWTNITPFQPGVVGVDVASTTETVNSARFYSPNGLQVNKDITHPDFGVVYVAAGSPGGNTPSEATGAYHTKSGVYFLNCDLSDTGRGWLEDATNTLFNSGSQYNPFKLNVDTDRGVIVCGGYSDGWEDLYFIDLDGSSYVTAFSRADFATIPSASWENCLHSAFTGTGASTKLWSNFEKDNSYPSIGTWDLGAWPISGSITAPWELMIDDSGAVNATNSIGSTCYSIRTLVVSPDESALFFSNRRWAESTIACAKMDITGPTLPQLIARTWSWRSAFTGTDQMYGNFNSVDYGENPDGDQLVLQRYYGPGWIYIVDPSDMSLIDYFMPDPDRGGTGTTCQCVFDAVGNVVYSDLTREWVRVYAPPSAPYTFNIDFVSTFEIAEITGVDSADWELYR